MFTSLTEYLLSEKNAALEKKFEMFSERTDVPGSQHRNFTWRTYTIDFVAALGYSVIGAGTVPGLRRFPIHQERCHHGSCYAMLPSHRPLFLFLQQNERRERSCRQWAATSRMRSL